MADMLKRFMGAKSSIGVSKELAQKLVFINSDLGNQQFKMYNEQTGEITMLSDRQGKEYVTSILNQNVTLTEEFYAIIQIKGFVTKKKASNLEYIDPRTARGQAQIRMSFYQAFVPEQGQDPEKFEAVLPEQYKRLFNDVKVDINKLLNASESLTSGEVQTMHQNLIGDLVEDPALHAAVTQDDKNTQQDSMKQLKEAQTQQMEGKTLPVADIGQLDEDVNLAVKETQTNSTVGAQTPLPTSVGPATGGGRQTPAVSVLSEETVPLDTEAMRPRQGADPQFSEQTGVVEPITPVVPVLSTATATQTATGTGLPPVPEQPPAQGTISADQQAVPGSVPVTGIAGTSAAPEVVRSAVYHKAAITIFFNSAENPQWDTDLTKNILSSGISTQEANKIMQDIVDSEGPQILVSEVKSAGTTQELIEILQLHFSLHRQMSKGTRVPTVGIPLGALMSAFNTPATANTPTTDTSSQPIAQAIQPEVPVNVNLAKAWEQRNDWGGGLRSGPSSTKIHENVEQNTRIKIYNEVGPGLEPPRIKGFQLLRVQLEDHEC